MTYKNSIIIITLFLQHLQFTERLGRQIKGSTTQSKDTQHRKMDIKKTTVEDNTLIQHNKGLILKNDEIK